MLLLPLMANAVEKVGDIYYYFYDSTAVVTNKYNGYAGKNSYTGNISIPESFTYQGKTYRVVGINEDAFNGCAGLTSIIIPNSVTSIGESVFYGCSGLTSITIPNSVTSIGQYVFYGCSGLTSITISNSVTSIGKSTFEGCSSLTCITIPNSVTSIGKSTFSNCSSLTSITIPNSVTSIGESAFSDCSGLTSITIPNSVTSIGERTFANCSGLTSITIPNSVTSIGSFAFWQCSGLTSITIPNSVTSIGSSGFSGCSGLTSITIPNSVTSIGSSAFTDCSGLTSITIPNSVTSIGSSAFYGCQNLRTVNLGNGVKEVSKNTFCNCQNLQSVETGGNYFTIDLGAFDCSYKWAPSVFIKSFNVKVINTYIQPSYGERYEKPSIRLFVKKSSQTRFNIYKVGDMDCYDIDTQVRLPKPEMYWTSTQTTANLRIQPIYDEFVYELDGQPLAGTKYSYTNGIPFIGSEYTYTGLQPNEYFKHELKVTYNQDSYTVYSGKDFNTRSLNPKVDFAKIDPVTVLVTASYNKGDAFVADVDLSLRGKKVEAEEKEDEYKRYYYVNLMNLDPNITCNAEFNVTIKYGDNNELTKTFTYKNSIKTDALTFTTLQPKVISLGNVIVAAQSNLVTETENVGFEWRRTDWTDDFPSNTGQAFLYEGQLEGYIRNLNTEKLWKFRPYYESASGNRYYGEWMGLDPTNTSYFEPTVHTYAKVEVLGNTANVKGYAMRGSDNITSQGFMYWKQTAASRSEAPSIPSSAQTVTAKGNVMEASLTNLDYETTYCYVAFATTAEGETFYGDQRQFTTGEDVTSIEPGMATTELAKPVAYYDLSGRHIDKPQQGLVIARMSDGTTRKMVVKK